MKCSIIWGQMMLERLLSWLRFNKTRFIFFIKYNIIKHKKVYFLRGGEA